MSTMENLQLATQHKINVKEVILESLQNKILQDHVKISNTELDNRIKGIQRIQKDILQLKKKLI